MATPQIGNMHSDYIDIEGRKKNFISKIYNHLCIISCGILYIITKHLPNLKIYLITRKSRLKEADCVVLTNKYGKKELIEVKEYEIKNSKNLSKFILNGKIKTIDTEYGRCLFNPSLNKYMLSQYKVNKKYPINYKLHRDNEEYDLSEKRILYGNNVCDLKLKKNMEVLIDGVFNLTVFINLFCIILYCCIDYKIYAFITACIFLYTYTNEILIELKKINMMRKNNVKTKIKIYRRDEFRYTDSSDIYPGDFIGIEPCKEFPCDVILLKGDIICDESFLTGENIPIYKSSALNPVVYAGCSILKTANDINFSTDNTNSLRRVLNLIKDTEQNNNLVIGMVINTGFNTFKGKILRDVINPKPVNVKFLEIAKKNIFITVLTSTVGSLFLLLYLVKYLNWDKKQVFIYTFDLFFTLASPTLYSSLSIGSHISYNRLKEENIICNNMDRIYIGGNVDIALFDKTGTLTSEGMELSFIDNLDKQVNNINDTDELTRIGLSSCHSINELNGKYCGDTLDLQMFIFSQSKLEYTEDNMRKIRIGNYGSIVGPFLKEYDEVSEILFYQKKSDNMQIYESSKIREVKILKTVDFTSESRMMSVEVLDKDRKYLFCKGSPDKIGSLLKNKPDFYDEKVREHSLNGLRVIALAYKDITHKKDSDLIFLCLIIFCNKLKPESKSVIKEIKDANILPKICTGDNILTAINVGRECGIIDETTMIIFPVISDECRNIYEVEWMCLGEEDLYFDKVKMSLHRNGCDTYIDDFVVACEGKEYDFFMNSNYYKFILEKGVIFARFSPNQKKDIVENYRNLQNVVLFCGDGGNDSGAIGSADVGISLAENDGCIGASFICKNIDKVPVIIKECRNSYVTTIASFKFVLTTAYVLYFTLMFLTLRNSFLTDFQSLHIDTFVVLPVTYFLSKFKRSNILHRRKPTYLIKTDINISRLLLYVVPIVVYNFLISLFNKPNVKLEMVSKTSTTLYFTVTSQIILYGILVSDYTPYRESILENMKMLIVTGLLFLINMIFLLVLYLYGSSNLLISLYKFHDISRSDFLKIYLFTGLNFLISIPLNRLAKMN